MKRLLFIPLLLCFALPALAFPDNGVLDAFTGCTDTTTPPNSNWTNAVFIGASSSTVDCEDQAVESTTNNVEGDIYYNPTTFDAACEAYYTIIDVTAGFNGNVWCRLANIGVGTTDGYFVSWDDSLSEIKIFRADNASGTQLGATITQAIDNADRVGIHTVGDQICAWFSDDGAAWTELGCRTDATYSSGGYIGISVRGGGSNVGFADDFGGGNVTTRSGGGVLWLD